MASIYLCISILIIFAIYSYASDPCPGNCTCTKMRVISRYKVDCTRLRITSFPAASSLPLDMYEYDLSMNSIVKVDIMETTVHLEFLKLASNDIKEIEPKAFAHLPSLVSLDLSHNELENVPEELLYGLDQLQHLNLSYNNLKLLPSELFANKPHMQELHISHNLFHHLQPEVFDHLSDLKVLDMSAIGAYSLKERYYSMLHRLIELDISDNDLTVVPTNEIRAARRLEILKLSGNPIRVLNEDSFRKMGTLKELYLDNMKELTQIKFKTFSYLNNLRKISISNNPHLSFLDKNAFLETTENMWINLREVDLRANRLTVLSEKTLPWCNIKILDLRQNPWMCDCNLIWLKKCDLKGVLSSGVICAHPKKLNGVEFMAADKEELVCDHEDIYREAKMLRLFVILFGAFLLFVMGLIFVLFIKRDRVVRWWSDRRRGTGAIYYVKAHSNPMDGDI